MKNLKSGGDLGVDFRSQKKILKKLTNEKSDLLNDLKTVKNPAHHSHENIKIAKIIELIAKHNELEKRLQKDKIELADLKFDLLKVQKAVNNISLKETKKIAIESDAVARQQTYLERLENRLESERKSFDSLVARNQTICTRIEHLILLRLNFLKGWQTLVNDLSAGKKYSLEVLEYVQEAYTARQQWHNKLEIVKQKTENAKVTLENELNSIQRDLDNDLGLYRFIDIKTQQRVLVDYDRKRSDREVRARQFLESQIDNYEKVLAQIKDDNDEDNVDSLCSLFQRRETDNMAHFSYANDQNNEVEKLRKSIDQLTILIDNENKKNKSLDDKHRSTIEHLSLELNRLKEKERKSSAELSRQREKITCYFGELETIFAMLQCDNTPILKLLGNTENITVFNVSMFLGKLPEQFLLHKNRTVRESSDSSKKFKEKVFRCGFYVAGIVPVIFLRLIEENVMNLLLSRGFFNFKENSKRLDFNDDDDDDDEQMSIGAGVPATGTNQDTGCQQMCSRCLLQEKLNDINDDMETVRNRNDILELLGEKLKRPDIKKALHRESVCQLPTLVPK